MNPTAEGDRIFAELALVAKRLHASGICERVGSNLAVLVQVPGEPHPMCAMFLCLPAGIMLSRGEHAAASHLEMLEAPPEELWSLRSGSQLILPLDSAGVGLPSELMEVLDLLAPDVERKPHPLVTVHEPRRNPRFASHEELELMTAALSGILFAIERGLLEPVELRQYCTLQCLTVAGNPGEVRVNFEWRELNAVVQPPSGLIGVSSRLAQLPVGDQHLLVGLVDVPQSSRAPRARPRRTLLVYLKGWSEPLVAEAIKDGDHAAASKIILGALAPSGSGCEYELPRSVTFGHRVLFNALSPGFEAVGIETRYKSRHPVLLRQQLRWTVSLQGRLDRDMHAPREPGKLEVAAWRREMDRLSRRIFEMVTFELQYFGAPLDCYFNPFGEDFMDVDYERLAELGILAGPALLYAYMEWVFFAVPTLPDSYRSMAEEMAAEPSLPPGERALLRVTCSRGREAEQLRVEFIGPGGVLGLSELPHGHLQIVHHWDPGFRPAIGSIVILRLFRLKKLTLATTAGPVLTPEQFARSLAELADLEDGWFPDSHGAEDVGPLWQWYAEEVATDLVDLAAPTAASDSSGEEEVETVSDDDLEVLSELIHDYYMKWLDRPRPHRDDLTPRQETQDADSRIRTRREILCLPPPMGGSGLQYSVPRTVMLCELGLLPKNESDDDDPVLKLLLG